MAAFEDDDDLQRAIALSLQDAPGAGEQNGGSSYDEDMRLAMALSLEGMGKADDVEDSSGLRARVGGSSQYADATTAKDEDRAQQQIETPIATSSEPSKPPGAFKLDRKAMEQERLARLAKRKRSASPERSSKQQVAKQITQESKSTTSTPLQYPKGAVKRTWAYKHNRTDDISIDEVLQASTLNIAILSSFQWDDKFVFHKADPKRIKQYWIMGAKGDDLKAKLLQELAECRIPNLKPHFPPMNGSISNMHSKLMLLFYDAHLRIVVPTANLMKFEWGETGQDRTTKGTWQPAVLENTVFLIDLPRRPDGKVAEKLETAFGEELISFLEAQEVGKNIIEGLRRFDFSETTRFAFVHSIGGSHSTEPNRSHTGLPGLARAIRKLNLHDVERLEIDYASSSLGALKEDFLQQLYLAASGLAPVTSKAPKGFLDRIRIYFPTKDVIVKSTGGVDCGGIITLDRKFYNNSTFPRQCLRNHKSTRPGLLSHNKLLLVRGYKKDGAPFAWAYVGSANATQAAWGKQSLLKSGKESALSISNWECGVVVPVPREKLQDFTNGEIPPMSVFDGTVEVPFQFPGEKYEDLEPWFFQDYPPSDVG